MTDPAPMTVANKGRGVYVPCTIRERSRIVSWLWRRGLFSYDRARGLARWLP